MNNRATVKLEPSNSLTKINKSDYKKTEIMQFVEYIEFHILFMLYLLIKHLVKYLFMYLFIHE